jgi:CubicO group peptidase (beta-lactamase class C family)
MNRLLPAVVALALASCLGGDDNEARQEYPNAILEAEEIGYQILRNGGSSVGVALVDRDRVVWAGAFGMADLEAGVAADQDTLFPIGSVTKMFAAVSVMQLVDRGLVELDRPVIDYLPTFTMADPRYAQITVRMLINHTSGIPGTRYVGAETTLEVPGYGQAVLEALADERLKADPGAFGVYCNDAYTLVDPLVEAVTQTPYREWVKQEIFAPLGMTRSGFSTGMYPDGSYAKAYLRGVAQPEECVNVDAAGGVYSTPTEMAAFVQMFLNQGVAGGAQVLSPESVAAMGVDQTAGTFNPVPAEIMRFGLGWDSVAEPSLAGSGLTGWTKNGGTYYYGSQILVAPDEGLAAVALGPAGGGYNPLEIVERVMNRALAERGSIPAFPEPLAPRAAPAADPPAEALAAIAGYYGNWQQLFQLRAEDDGTLTMLSFLPTGWTPAMVLRFRDDGWWTADAAPLVSYSLASAGGNDYLVVRSPAADKSLLLSMLYAQKLTPLGAGLPTAWAARLDRKWLIVNEHYAGLPFLQDKDPRFGLETLDELPGVLLALTSLPPMGLAWQVQAVDASQSDVTGHMLLLIPGIEGTDINDLDVVVRDGEEWLRWGAAYHRPLETVPQLATGDTTVTIGGEGFAEWRSVQRGADAIALAVAGATAWRLYDDGFGALGAGLAGDPPVVADGTGLAYLMLFGDAGAAITVTMP